MNEWILAIISGVVSGLLVSFILVYLEIYKWYKIKREIFILIDKQLNLILTSFRFLLDISWSENFKNNDQLIDFFDNKILGEYGLFWEKIGYPELEKMQKIQGDFNSISKDLERLEILLFSFRIISPKEIGWLLNIKKKLDTCLFFYKTFPEIGDRNFDSDDRFDQMREMTFNDFKNFITLILDIKKKLSREIKMRRLSPPKRFFSYLTSVKNTQQELFYGT